MTYDEFLNFLDGFEEIKSFVGKIRAADQNLTRIGSGSGRIVYDIDGEKVFKVAKNSKGIAQNSEEAGTGQYHDTHHIVTKVFDSANDDSWVISEKGKKVTENRIKELTGIPSLNELFHYVKNFQSSNNGRGNIFNQKPEVVEELNNNEFANDLTEFIANYNQQPGDYGRPSSYGEVIRDGQPAIVLTDYGLSDEVYDTHYSSNRKQQYQMYEMYNFADGNDDILSDIGNNGEVRQSMWGLMPYDVNDGDGVINEDFISFVLNRDKYPTRPLPSAPYIVDEFHNIVNNLTETLNHVDNKKKFYNNLLELQNYLIRGKFYDRKPLEKEMVELNEDNIPVVQQNELDKTQADKIANAFATKMNLGQPNYLGGGGYGEAYAINDNKVLKLTTDACEVDAGGKINRAKPKTLAYVYNIYKIIDTEQNMAVYALIEDNITNKPNEEFLRYKDIIDSLDSTGENGLYVKLLTVLVKGKSKEPEFAGKTINDFPELAQQILTNLPEANISQSDRQNSYNFMMGLYAIKMELQELNIKSKDFVESKNLGYKNGILMFFDVGGCIVEEPSFLQQNVISLPENVEIMNEGLEREITDNIANVVSQKYNYGNPKYIGSGNFGVAYDNGNDLILKVTSDKSEANENLMLIGKQLKYIAQLYKVFSVKSKSTDKEIYVIILEKLKTNPAEFKAIKDRMDFAFSKILGFNYPDVVDYYVNGPSPGLDVDSEKVDKYLLRNPKDAEFFNDILKIGNEVKNYGIESMDYINPLNLGYKKDGNLGFFDVGFGNPYFKANYKPEEITVDEDGSSKFSTENNIAQDDFPTYDQNDTSPLTDNNIPVNTNEDLNYHHVNDATQDKYEIDERIVSSMPGSSSVEVKKKCRLAGNGNTSTACNQGDIGNLNVKKI